MTQEEAIKQALAKASTDSAFKSALMTDVVGTLSQEFPGVEFDQNISLNIELSDDDLDAVSGGLSGSTTTGSDGDDDDSGCTRGTGYGNSGQGQQKGQGQDNGQGQGLNSD